MSIHSGGYDLGFFVMVKDICAYMPFAHLTRLISSDLLHPDSTFM